MGSREGRGRAEWLLGLQGRAGNTAGRGTGREEKKQERDHVEGVSGTGRSTCAREKRAVIEVRSSGKQLLL